MSVEVFSTTRERKRFFQRQSTDANETKTTKHHLENSYDLDRRGKKVRATGNEIDRYLVISRP